MEHKLRLDEGR